MRAKTRPRGRPYRRPMESTTTIWALGDYHRIAKDLYWSYGPTLVAACGISPGQRVLDVAAGTGNVAIRAAQAGASVVASDLEPAQFEAGRREAQACGVELEWVQADAAALPFADGEFDVVTSSAGAIFAPDHQATADELVRVCRPGGTIGMLTFTPEGMAGEFFELFGRYAPPPEPGEQDPILWGDEEHVRELFGDRARAAVHARHVRRARARRAARAARLLQADLRPGDRDLREPRRRPPRGARPRVARVRGALEHRYARRPGRAARRVPADRRPPPA